MSASKVGQPTFHSVAGKNETSPLSLCKILTKIALSIIIGIGVFFFLHFETDLSLNLKLIVSGACLVITLLITLGLFSNRKKIPSSTDKPLTAPDPSPIKTIEKTAFHFDPPKYVKTKSGLLANAHFEWFLKYKVPANQREAWLQWSFSQRKCTTVFDAATILLRGRLINGEIYGGVKPGFLQLPQQDQEAFGLFIDEEGYAQVSNSHVGDVNFRNEDILEIEQCVRVELRGKQIIGFYADGKCIIQQPAPLGCVATSAAMLITDKGLDYDYSSLTSENRSNGNERSMQILNNKGLKTCIVNDLEKGLSRFGSLTIGASFPIGGHRVVLDEITNDYVKIRDPFHGWRVKIKKEAFFKQVKGITAVGLV